MGGSDSDITTRSGEGRLAQPASLVPRSEAFALWLKVGMLSFGGPAGQIALMHRLVVQEKRWIGEARFLSALNFCMLLPGPEAQQLATYIGWLMGGLRGGLMAGVLFVLPGAMFMLLLSVLYARYADLPLLQAVFYGVKGAVIAIVLEALLRISRRALKQKSLYWVAAASFVSIFAFGVPFPIIVLAAGILGAFLQRPAASSAPTVTPLPGQQTSVSLPLIDRALDDGALVHVQPRIRRTMLALCTGLALWFLPLLAVGYAFGFGSRFWQLSRFFSEMSIVTFGGAYAVLAYVADQAVNTYHWLTAAEMLHGLGLAETTPGPLILVLQFVGYLAAYRAHGPGLPFLNGLLGTAIMLWATFVPSMLWIFIGAPYAETIRKTPALSAALEGITAAVVGVVLNLTVWFALHSLFGNLHRLTWGALDLPAPQWSTFDPVLLLIAMGAGTALLWFRWNLLLVLCAAAIAGLLVRVAGM